jgi:glycosyltransferase involved in cell wall biosynthesis
MNTFLFATSIQNAFSVDQTLSLKLQQFHISGWFLLDQSHPAAIRAVVRQRIKKKVFAAKPVCRPDVIRHLSISEKAVECGFEVKILLFPQTNRIFLQFYNHGKWHTFFRYRYDNTRRLEAQPERFKSFPSIRNFFNNTPTVSVVLPVYNGEAYLKEAIESILTQQYEDFECIILDDGSTDASRIIIQDYAGCDARVKPIYNSENLGLVWTLNKGLSLCRGKYVARQDADDLSYRDRFNEQVNYLNVNRDAGVVGSAMEVIDEKGNTLYFYRLPETDPEIRFRLLFNSAIVHPSAMMRKSLLDKYHMYYNPTYEYAEDYDLWTRLLYVTKAFNLQKPLIKYRITLTGQSQSFSRRQNEIANVISNQQLKRLDPNVSLSWPQKVVMLEIYQKFFWGEWNGLTADELFILPELYSISNKFIKMYRVTEKRLLHFRERIHQTMLCNGDG